MNRNRLFHIDFLRAIAILAVIITHVFSYNLTNSLNTAIWNYSHFQIVAFVFCSGYVLYAFYADKVTSFSHLGEWYIKRIIRLLLPFYYFLLTHYTLLLLFPTFFSGLGLQLTGNYFLASATLFGGIGTNWLPLLFIELATIFPLLIFLLKQHKYLFRSYIFIAATSLIYFSIMQFPYAYYKEVMLLPWSLPFILSWYFVKKDEKKLQTKIYFFIALAGGILFIVLHTIWPLLHKSMNLIDNKYPPNLFDMSFEFFGSFLFLSMSNFKLWKQKFVEQGITFISRNSYALFFIHYIVSDFILQVEKLLQVNWNVFFQLGIILFLSLLIAYLLEKLLEFSQRLSFV